MLKIMFIIIDYHPATGKVVMSLELPENKIVVNTKFLDHIRICVDLGNLA